MSSLMNVIEFDLHKNLSKLVITASKREKQIR